MIQASRNVGEVQHPGPLDTKSTGFHPENPPFFGTVGEKLVALGRGRGVLKNFRGWDGGQEKVNLFLSPSQVAFLGSQWGLISHQLTRNRVHTGQNIFIFSLKFPTKFPKFPPNQWHFGCVLVGIVLAASG